MSRRFTASLVLLLAAGLAPHALPANAATAGSSVTAAAPAVKAKTPLIKGVVVDQFGAPVDDVKVIATDKSGKAVASALTYASVWPGGPQHGFFYLEVGDKGTFTLQLSKVGYKPVTSGPHAITTTKKKLALGEIVIPKVLAPTTTAAALADKSVTTKETGKVTVTVTSKVTKKPVGEVQVLEGKKVVGSGTIAAKAKGKLTLTLAKLGKGVHVLSVRYLGTTTLAPSVAAKKLTLTVAKPRR